MRAFELEGGGGVEPAVRRPLRPHRPRFQLDPGMTSCGGYGPNIKNSWSEGDWHERREGVQTCFILFQHSVRRAPARGVGEEIAGSRLHVLLNGRQIYNTWKKQLGRGFRRLQSGEINPHNETGKAEGKNELWAGVQRRACQKGPGSP